MEQETYVFKNEDYESHFDKIRRYIRPALWGLVTVLLLLTALLIFTRCERTKTEESVSKPSFALYLKTGELNFTDTDMQKRLSSNLKTMSNQENYSFSVDKINKIGGFVSVSSDGERVFFCDKAADGDGTVSLYVADVNKTDPPLLISKNAKEYTVSGDGERAVVLDSDSRLLIYELGESKLISENVKSYITSSDCKRVYLRDINANLYVYRQGGKLTLMTEALVSSLLGADESFDTVYYTDSNGDVIKQKRGGLPVTLIDGENAALSLAYMHSFADNTAYFICNRSSSDNGIWYMSADGKVQKLPLKNAGTVTCIATAKDTAAAMLEIKDADGKNTEYFVATGGAITKVYESDGAENHVKAKMNEEGTELYFFDINNSKTYFVKTDGASGVKPEFLGDKLDGELRGFYGGSIFALYFWQTENGVSEQGITLYKNGEAVARLRDTYFTAYCEKTDTFYFIGGYSEKTAKGTLMMYRENKVTELEKDVYDFTLTADGELLFIKDYSTLDKRGNLYQYSEEENIFIDRDVSAFVRVTENRRKLWE